MLLLRGIRRSFAKITKEDVLKSSYDELATLVARKYSNKQYRNANMVVLHEIQQQHKIIAPGDWVLDIGAGPNYYWTELALRLAENEKQSHRVISNDKLEPAGLRSNQVYVKGNFMDEQIRTNIGLKLGQRKFDTILVDASPQFTGKLEEDGAELNRIVFEAMYFSNVFLQKGGNFVCKVLNCESSKILEETARIFFHQFFTFRPSVIRDNSPVQFFIMKGFAMNYQLEAMKKFISQYRGSPKNKMEVVKEYQAKYSWDPIQIIRNKTKNDVLSLKMEGRSEREIENMFVNDPYIKIGEILRQIRLLEKATNEKDNLALKKAVNTFTQGKLCKDANEIPSNREEWINFLQKMENDIKQARKKDKPSRPGINLEPLRDNEVYMKNSHHTTDEAPTFLYIEADLEGKYQIGYQDEFLQQQIAKMQSNDPELSARVEKLKKGMKNKAQLDEVFNPDFMVREQDIVSAKLHAMTEALEAVTDEEFKAMMDKEGYENELQQNVGKRQTGSREKFKNR